MKRYGNLYDKICTYENIELAHKNAKKGKSSYKEVQMIDKNPEYYLKKIQKMLSEKTYCNSKYYVFTKNCNGKIREIYKLPYFPDRIVHHAIMQILSPIWNTLFIRDTFSAIKGRGIHDGVKRLQTALKYNISETTYCLKFDINKFYPSINNVILKEILQKKLKDQDVLNLLYTIIDSAKGVPIGNYLSQYFSNIYLSYFDHFCKETLKCKYYFRYCDDIVILSNSKQFLHTIFNKIQRYIGINLDLTIKNNYQIFPVADRGIDFLGYVFFHTFKKIRNKIKYNFVGACKHQCIDSIAAYKGWFLYANTYNLFSKHIQGVYL